MTRPSIFRLIIKDLIDFFIIAFVSSLLVMAIYRIGPGFSRVDLSIYFLEQYLELFFVNPKLILWLLGLGFGVTVIYFLFGAMLAGTTLGGVVVNLYPASIKTHGRLSLFQSLVMALGAYCGVLCVLMGPLSAWWLDKDHRGWSEKLARVVLRRNKP